jgi:tryptophan synthase alpha chain
VTALDRAFARAAKEKRAAFVPYLTAGDPDLETSVALIEALAKAGADAIELGVPFSDPIADGPVIQRAAARALAGGTTLAGVLAAVAHARRRVDVPIVLFSYFNPIHARGVESFAEQASASGVDGVLCLDLPPEEGEGVVPRLRAHGLDTVFLLAPTSTPARRKLAAAWSSGFVYYVSRTGTTGERTDVPAELAADVKAVRKATRLPVAVGFGISTPEQARAVGRVADGVVVGSALVRAVEEHAGASDLVAVIGARAAALRAALGGRR